LAAQAGLRVLQEGGNAIDAAVATAAALTVVEPTSNGLGSDAFAIVWSQGRLWGLNASGPAPAKLTPEWVQSLGHREEMPSYGWGAVTIPGAPAAWAALSQRFGSLTLKDTLKPAIQLAQEGFPVSPVVAYFWARAYERFSEQLSGPEFREWFRIFAPMGRAPYPGEIWASPDHARTLEEIGQRPDSYYHGQLADQIVQFSQRTGGVLTKDDLETFQPEWVSPIAVNFQGYDIWELPPNGQGLIALMALKMLEGLPCSSEAERIHQQIECLKLAFADGQKFVADPHYMTVSPDDLLADQYLNSRRKLVGDMAEDREAGSAKPGGTVYLAVADNRGNMVSYIQSNYSGFGSGLVVPNTGIALQNRGHLFTLNPGHPNSLAPGKRPYHTIIPGFLTHHGKPIGPFGVMGGFM
jgi:gamma-glutamyltranspeptidase/glutathione hydrolase